jgi:hypothetical protein
MIKAFVVLGAFLSLNAFAGNADFDAYMKSNANNRALTGKAKNQEAFSATAPYRATQQDPQVQANSGKMPDFKMGGSNSAGSFSGGSSGSSGAGAFKPTAVTTKPVTIKPAAAPSAQASNNQNQQPYFGTVGVNPTINNASTSSSPSSSSQGVVLPEYCRVPGMAGIRGCPATYSPTAAYGGTVGGYVNAANQQAGQIYGATGGRTPAQQAADQAAAAQAMQQQQINQQIQQGIIQNTVQNIQISIPR